MMKNFKNYHTLIVFLMLLYSCGKEELEINSNQDIKVISLEVTSETEDVLKNSTVQLFTAFSPVNATIKTVNWSSSDETIATVDANGLVTGKELGIVEITAKSDENQNIFNTISLNIIGNATTNEIISFKIKEKEATIDNQNLIFEFLEGTDISALAPTIIHNGKSISPSPELPQDFNNTVVYTVTAENGDKKEWEVKVILRQVTLSGPEFITTWKTDNPGSSEDNQISIPTFPGEVYDYTVDWGDGNVESGITGNIEHTYESIGTYTVTITGIFPRIYFNNLFNQETGDDDKIISINQWGTNAWTSMEYAFTGCENLQVVATDVPNLSQVQNLGYMFAGCLSLVGNYTFNAWNLANVTRINSLFFYATHFNVDISSWDIGNVEVTGFTFSSAESFNQDIGNWNMSKVFSTQGMFAYARTFNQDISQWDVSNVTSMDDMFIGMESFNQNIGNWDVGNVKRMSGLFYKASAFNQNIGNWDVSNVTHMNWMFREASAFNQDISNWDVSNVVDMNWMFGEALAFNQNIGNWDVSNVVQMGPMFSGAISFNQDIGGWDVSSVIWMYDMFNGASSFDQDLGNWQVSNVNRMENMFLNTSLSRENYDSLLEGWSSLSSLQNEVQFNAGDTQYCISESARQTLTDEYNWVILDGGKNCDLP